MNYSFSTVLMAILTSNLLIAVIALCIRNQKIMLSIGYKLLILFLLLTAIRFLLPLEMPFANNLYFPRWVSAVIALARHSIFSFGFIRISFTTLLGCTWLGGTIYYLRKMYLSKEVYRHYIIRYGEFQEDKEPYRSMMSEICNGRKKPLWIKRVEYYGAPMQYGTIRPYIVIPATLELSDNDLYFVLRHEAAHYFHHDALIKDAIGFIRAVYWWNPLCKVLEKKTALLLEMRVDGKLVDGDTVTRDAYCQTLDRINEKLQEDPGEESVIPGAEAAISMPVLKGEDLRYREIMMYRAKGRKSISFYLLAALVMAVYICSYCFTFEAYSMLPWDKEGVLNFGSDFYAIILDDGTYDIYLHHNDEDIYIENIDNLNRYIGIPIE